MSKGLVIFIVILVIIAIKNPDAFGHAISRLIDAISTAFSSATK